MDTGVRLTCGESFFTSADRMKEEKKKRRIVVGSRSRKESKRERERERILLTYRKRPAKLRSCNGLRSTEWVKCTCENAFFLFESVRVRDTSIFPLSKGRRKKEWRRERERAKHCYTKDIWDIGRAETHYTTGKSGYLLWHGRVGMSLWPASYRPLDLDSLFLNKRTSLAFVLLIPSELITTSRKMF